MYQKNNYIQFNPFLNGFAIFHMGNQCGPGSAGTSGSWIYTVTLMIKNNLKNLKVSCVDLD